MQRFDRKAMIFIVLSSLETVHDTVQYKYCIFFIALSSLEDYAKTSESLTFIRTRERQSTLQMYNVVYSTFYIINLFNVDNVLLA